KHVNNGDDVYVCEVTSGKDQKRLVNIKNEALASHKILGVTETLFLELPVVALADIPTKELNKAFFNMVEKVKPNTAYIPRKGNMHIDQTMVAESAMVALRPVNNPQLKAIYAYETLSETEWNIPSVDNIFIPNVWTDITDTIDKKLEAMSCYKSQLYDFPHPRSLEAIQSLAKLRGSTICVNHAESFMLIRSIM